jgi:Dullard-like phosphatase family protein
MYLLIQIGLNIRPFWKECLDGIKKDYVIIIYTASHQSYADSVLNYLDPNNEYFEYRLYRHNCVEAYVEGEKLYVKDLRILKNVKMENMTIIDNSVLSFAFQLENGIPILPFYDNYDDNELLFLKNYLCDISSSNDLRIENKTRIKMDYFLEAAKDEVYKEEVKNEYKSNQSEETKTGLFELNIMNYSSLESDSDLNSSEIIEGRKEKKRNSKFQEQLIHTLDDLKKTFEKSNSNK